MEAEPCAIETEFVEANGLRFEVLSCGAGPRFALLLHGFPEVADCWRAQMPVLAALGYRVWAPNQRGYGASSRPSGVAAYAMEHLLADVAGLVDAAHARFSLVDTTLIAHDWGALVAWTFAARQVRPLARLVILNVPHPVCFARAVRRSPRQMLRSWYVLFFQIPRLADWALGRRGGELAGRMMLQTSTDPAHFPQDLVRACCRNAASPGGATAMLNWYRAAVRGGGLRRQLKLGFPAIDIPVLLLWGEADTAHAREPLEGSGDFERQLTKVLLPGVSHWVQQDATLACNGALVEFLR